VCVSIFCNMIWYELDALGIYLILFCRQEIIRSWTGVQLQPLNPEGTPQKQERKFIQVNWAMYYCFHLSYSLSLSLIHTHVGFSCFGTYIFPKKHHLVWFISCFPQTMWDGGWIKMIIFFSNDILCLIIYDN